ncbi:retrotransposon protein, putative, ty1-copia subclass, partial [Tanacetum coccineum]
MKSFNHNTMFEKQARLERFDLIQTFHACKQEEGKLVAAYFVQMKGYVDKLERLGYMLPQDLIVGLILNSFTKDFARFVRNYNMHNMGKTIGELHAMLIEYEKGLPKKAETPQVMMIKGGKIQKAKKKSLKAKGKGKANGKGNDKQVYIPKPKNPKPSAKEHPAKDDTCHHCKEVGHWKRNCHVYLAELLKKKKQVGSASSSGIFIIELFSFPNKSWVYDTGCGTHICITKQGFREARKLKQGALYLYVGNGVRAQVEAIGSYDLVLPNGLVICLDNCHYAPSITRGVVSVHRLKHIEKLQQEGLLKSTDDESFDQCVSCLSGKMTRKSFPHRPERATDLLGIIHTDVCGLLRHVSRQGASYFITFTDDYSRYGYVYLLKHKHEVFETFKVFKNKVENQLGKTIKALRSDRGGEYISQEFKDYLKACGIVQQLTPPYTPQHNDVSERRNQSATRILNMVPTKKVDKTPYELCKMPMEVEGFKPPQEEGILIRRSERSRGVPNRLCLNVETKEHNLGDLNEPTRYKAAMLDSESNKSKAMIRLGQIAYLDKILKRYNMDNFQTWSLSTCKKIDLNKTQGTSTPKEVKHMQNVPYASAVGSIMYAVRCTRPDVVFANTKDMFLVYDGNSEAELRVDCYCDAGFETDRDDTKSQTGYVFILNGGAVDWKSSKQSTTAMSATEAEYIAASEVAMEAVWFRKFISGLANSKLKFYDMRSASKVFDEMSERKHKVCDIHSKSLKVIVAGLEHRFCQQCIWFHGLPELDGKNQRCRKQLTNHNARCRPVWGCDRLVIRAKVIENQIMAASAIIISSDSSDESVGSPPSRVILFGDIPTVIPSTSVVAPETSTIAPVISSAAPMVETTLVASPTGLCGLVPYTGSDSDSPDEMSSPEHISPLPAISPFICTDSSEAPDSSDGPPSQDPYVATVARWRSRVTARPSSSYEFPIAPVTAPPGIRRRSAILIRPGEAIPFGRPYRTHLNGPSASHHHSSSSSSSSDSSPVHSLGLDASDQAHSGSSTRDVSPDYRYPPSGGVFAIEEDAEVVWSLVLVDRDDVGEIMSVDLRDVRDGNRGGWQLSLGSVRDMLVDLDYVVREFYHHMSEVRIDRIIGIETAQRQLEADQLVRCTLVRIWTNFNESYLWSCLRLHMSLSQEEFRQIRRDRDDARGRLRRTLGQWLGLDEAHQVNQNLELGNGNDNGNDNGNGNGNDNGNGNGNGNNGGDNGDGNENHNVMEKTVDRFLELTMCATKMVLWRSRKWRKKIHVGGLPISSNGNVIAAELHKTTRCLFELHILDWDQKLKGYANTGGQNVARAYVAGNNEKREYEGTLLSATKCKIHHCRALATTRCAEDAIRTLSEGLSQTQEPKTLKPIARVPDTRGKAYVLGGGDANPGPNTVTGTFLLNDHHAYMLFDSGADRSFVSNTFSALLDIIPYDLDVSYAVELADGRTSETNTVLRGCTLGLLGHPFNIDLMPVDLGSFDVIIGMDWLAKNHAVIVCDEKIVRIPYGNKILIVQGDKSDKEKKSTLSIISCVKAQKYMEKGCQLFLA